MQRVVRSCKKFRLLWITDHSLLGLDSWTIESFDQALASTKGGESSVYLAEMLPDPQHMAAPGDN